MKYVAILLTVLALLAVTAFIIVPAPTEPVIEEDANSGEQVTNEGVAPRVEVIAEGLEIPWDIAFLPNGSMLVTERTGHVIELAADGTKKEIPVPGVRQGGEGGLLGLVLHPDFASNNFVYLYMSTPDTTEQTQNRVVRYVFKDETLTQDKIIIEGIPGAIYHDGGRMEFGPDDMLYITTGDATSPDIAQNLQSLGGKILRLTPEGEPAPGNPFNTRVYSYGHRNPQGLAWDSEKQLWATEHGPTGEQGECCHDEINLIKKGSNYGWPKILANEDAEGIVSPRWESGTDTWAPASLVHLNGSLFFGGLRGEALYEAVLNGSQVSEIKEHFKGDYGRIRTVRLGPDNLLYITTSNTDGRGNPAQGDDKILRVNPELL